MAAAVPMATAQVPIMAWCSLPMERPAPADRSAGNNLLAAGGAVIPGATKAILGVLASGRLFGALDEPHAQGTGNPDRLETGERLGSVLICLAQFGALITDVLGVDEHRGDAGADQGGFLVRRLYNRRGYLQIVHQIAGGEEGPPSSPSSDGSRNSSTISAAGRSPRPARNRLSPAPGRLSPARGRDGLADIGLPDPHLAGAALRDAGRSTRPAWMAKARRRWRGCRSCRSSPRMPCRWRPGRRGSPHRDRVAGFWRGSRTWLWRRWPHAVHVGAVGVGAADDPEEGIPCRARLLAALGQVR